MINLFIVWVICLGLGIAISSSRSNRQNRSDKVKAILFTPWIVLALISVIYLAPLDVLEKFNLIKVTEGEQVSIPDGASFMLSSGTSGVTASSYFITSETTQEDLESWINKQTKSIFLYVKQGDETIYSLDYGITRSKDFVSEVASKALKSYSDAKASGSLTKDTYRVEFLVFYLERNFS